MIAQGYDAFLFDLDGVLYRAAEPVVGAAEAVAALRGLGKRVAFLTNNSARTPEEVAEHLRGVGVQASAEEVETSALSTAGFVRERGVTTAFVVGERGLREAV
ncbi:MAG TPA: HAD family hydrolase, partial [Actinomycetota bacterium]|nr:HAD family hydrolase [Actinomycetota bacterium]